MSSLPSSSYASLYEEADTVSSLPGAFRDAAEDICPLYHALTRIEERYSGEELIGTGGMKEVFRVYDERTERHVALARPKKGVKPERYDAFLREAHITARLEHPNIINLFDMGIDDQQRPFFTMEFKRGLSLRRILAGLRKGEEALDYPYEQRLSIFLRICEAMAYAHSRHVLHLDIKPDNIQVGPFGEVQVCDWGMGEIERGESEEHLSEALLDPDLYGGQLEPAAKGTPGYMAPEHRDPNVPKSAQNDVFALGCLLYELTTLEAAAHRNGNPPRSPAVAAIVNKACAADLGERYATVEAMREDVNRHLLGFSPEAEQSGFLREARLFYRRNRQVCLTAFCFSSILLAGGLWSAHQLRLENQRTSEALENTEEALEVAQTERSNAERALARLEREKQLAVVLLERQSENAYEGARLLMDTLIMDASISLSAVENAFAEMEKALAANPPKTDPLWTQMGFALFMTQRFAEAEEYYAVNPSDPDLRKLIPEFAPLVGDDGVLPVDEFIRLIRILATSKPLRSPLIEKMVICDRLKRESLAEEARIVKTVIELINPYWREPQFEFELASRHLSIGGAGLRSLLRWQARFKARGLYPRQCLLRLLEIRSLEIRNTGFGELNQLVGLELHRLDLRRAIGVKELSPLAAIVSLREVIVKPGQFTAEQLAVLPKSVAVREQ